MSKFNRSIVTAALPYANGPLHLGHIAGAYLPADLFVRYKRSMQEDILFICGSDEHGVPITIAAEKENVSPQDIVDRYHQMNKVAFEKLGISFDYYGRTSSEMHKQTSQEFFSVLNDKGTFVRKSQDQLFDTEANMFLPDRYVYGTCPNCDYDHAYGDQCENCGTSLSPTDLINPKSAITNTTPVKKQTEHWFLPLGELQPKLENWFKSQGDWKSNVYGQVNSWFQQGLSDRAVTRDLSWGVPVPLKEAEGKVLYVWFDAPIGYISATKEWAKQQGDDSAWEKYWMKDDSRLIHFIGKDNIVFHCLIFPAMLMEHGKFVVPDQVPANEFLNLEGQKLSTSRGWAVWTQEFLEEFDADLLRYVLTAIMPENKDADFSWKEFQSRINTELADILGNFLFRTQTFVHKYFEGKVPEPKNLSEIDTQALATIKEQFKLASDAYENFSFKEALQQSMQLARIGNKYLTETEPWKTRKSDPQKCANAVYVSVQIASALSQIFDPILPNKMQILRKALGLGLQSNWSNIETESISSGKSIAVPEILFAKIEDDAIQKQLDHLQEKLVKSDSEKDSTPSKDYEPIKKPINFDDFVKLDLRVAQIVEAEKIKKSKKMLQLRLDLGFEQRTVLSGIAQSYETADLLGKKVVLVANLEPRKMLGVVSEGMVLMADDRDEKLHFISSDAENGSTIS